MPLLQLLGTPKLVTEDTVMDIPPKQALLLGSYLAYKEDWASRDELVHLFWPDESEKTARHNLSQLLYHCKKQIWMQGLETERQRVRWLVDTDVKRFQQALGGGGWSAATKHYEGSLLEGVATNYALNFESWLLSERESLKNAWREAALNQAKELEFASSYTEASQLLRSVLTQDPLAEDVLQAYMRCAFKDNQREQALKSFDVFAKHLAQELDMEPLTSTQALAAEIRSSQVAKQAPQIKVASEAKLYAFPSEATPFIGRDIERAELADFFERSKTRLLSLLGAGGMGKSRLATQLSKEQAWRFKEGAVFLALAPLTDASLIATTLLQALGLSVPAEQSSEQALLDYLTDKQILLVFDNVEHLPDCVELIVELLEHCPTIFILTTSREALDLRNEQIYDISGLSYPSSPVDNAEAYDAVNLFLRAARRAHTKFVFETNKEAVLKLCQFLQGSPLGLELAAAWVRLLSCNEILEELEKNLDLLKANHQDAPERHESMRAVLEYSWALLSDAEQLALQNLAVFKGGFTKNAAQEVSAVAVRTLLALVNKSLLQRSTTGRFERHSVVQYFCFEKLELDPTRLAATQKQHSQFFLVFAEEAETSLRGQGQLEVLVRLDEELSNLRTALSWSLEQQDIKLAFALAAALGRYWELRGYYSEGREWLEKVFELSKVMAIQPSAELQAKALNAAGNLARVQGDNLNAKRQLEESLALYRNLKQSRSVAQVLSNLGLVLRSQGDYATARDLLNESLALQRKHKNERGVAQALNNLAIVAFWFGDYSEAQSLLEESLEIARNLDDKFGIANILNNLGNALRGQGAYLKAQAYQEESLALFRALKGQHGISQTLNNLALVAVELAEFNKAYDYLAESLELKREAKEERGVAQVLTNLGMVALHSEATQDAETYLNEALALHHSFEDKIGIAITLNIKGDLARKLQDYALAKELHSESLALFKELKDKLGQAESLGNLSKVAHANADYPKAERLSKESLSIHQQSNNPRGVAEALESLAKIYTCTERSKQAATLWAAATTLRQSINSKLTQAEQQVHKKTLELARQKAGVAVFEKAWRLGKTLSQADAIRFALEGEQATTLHQAAFTNKSSASH